MCSSPASDAPNLKMARETIVVATAFAFTRSLENGAARGQLGLLAEEPRQHGIAAAMHSGVRISLNRSPRKTRSPGSRGCRRSR
jgi:hypothetical protein